MQKLHLSTLSRFFLYIACLIIILSLITTLIKGVDKQSEQDILQLPLSDGISSNWSYDSILAYNVDIDMDRAREEQTVNHYGEGIREFVEDAIDNNADNPNAKPTAENTYQRDTALNKVLPETFPEAIGKDFSQKTLEKMESKD